MRDQAVDTRRWGSVLAVVGLVAVGTLLVFAAPSAARTIGPPRVLWSANKIEQGIGEVQIAHGAHRKSQLDEVFDLGPSAFSLGPLAGRGSDLIHSTNPLGTPITNASYVLEATAPSLAHRMPFALKGGVAHVDWFQAYEKRGRDADLQFKIDDLWLDNVDDNGPVLDPVECPAAQRCDSIQAIVRYHLRAWTVAGGHEFFNVGGGIFGDGHEHAWLVGAATSIDSARPFWSDARFHIDQDFQKNGTQSELFVRLPSPLVLSIPLGHVPRGALFAVHLTMDAEAIDDRGRESAAQAHVEDPPLPGRGLVARALTARAVPSIKEPPLRPRPAARCPAGPRPHAGRLQLSRPAYAVGEASGSPLVLVTRVGGSRGATSAIVDTHSGSATSGTDFEHTRTVVRFEDGDTSARLLEIPIREDRAAEPPESFTISLAHPRCGQLGTQRSSTVTILDDDQPPVPPPPAFTVSGAVDGLAGSGLVLVNQTTVLPVAGNGPFTFPGTFPAGSPYDVRVQAQPRNPDQVCSVVDGTGTITADVSNVAIHCANVATPTGLDKNFGLGGRVSTPGDGDARAVLARPDGRIIVVGRRGIGASLHFQFGAAEYDAAGNLDPGFGTGGVVTTDLGGSDDQAFDAADDRDGGFVAVGRTDAAGLTNTDFGVSRYTAAGQPNPAFPASGFVRTDVAGRGDGAKAVAVQPDGKIVAAGYAQTTPINFDFALVRYNPDGTLDRSFGGDGIVTTDIGDLNDSANAIAIQPDGNIVAVGDTGENIALARYLPNGQLDPTFGGSGTVVSDLGFDDVANGVAITPGGTILIAGTRLGPHVNLDPYVASYGPNGKLNLGFGESGVADTDLSGGDDFGDDLVLDSGGGIVAVGYASSPTVTDMALVRYRLDGTLDTFLTTDFHGAGDFGHALAVDPHGGVVATGTIANGSENEFGLVRALF